MIQKLEVKGLNNRVDASLEFNEDLNIITGRNGSGKTTLLKLIWYLVSGNLERIIPEILFQSASIETDSFSLFIRQVEPDMGELECEFHDGGGAIVDFGIPLRRADHEDIHQLNQQIARAVDSSLFFPTFRRIEGGFARSRYIVDDDSVTYRDRLRGRFGDRTTEHLQEAMSRLSTEVSVYDHKFIASISTHDIVELLTEKYADISEKTNQLHVKLSKEITQQISERNQLDDASPVLKGIQKRVEQVNEERDLLLKPFSVLSERIREIFQDKGIRVTSGITLGEVSEAIESDKLSSGEKQMLSFLCYNTFSENAAIFIDEPELSLHVDWQRLLVPTLLEQGTENQFFIATHSPFIYAKYPDKEIPLPEQARQPQHNEAETLQFSNHSANLIEEWLDDSEDEVWK
jgi:predicted ATPase